MANNVLGNALKPCCKFPMTGFYRAGYCNTGPEDLGKHTVCIRVTDEFLVFSQAAGNDLSTPRPELDFPGLIKGDQWCLCAERFKQALEHQAAPKVVLEATHEATLEIVSLDQLKAHAYNKDNSEETL